MAGDLKDLVHASRSAAAWVEIINLMLLCDDEGEPAIDVRCYSRTKCAADAIDNNGNLFIGLHEHTPPREFISIVSKVFTLEYITSEKKLKWFAMPLEQRERATEEEKKKLLLKAQEKAASLARATEQMRAISSPDNTPVKSSARDDDSDASSVSTLSPSPFVARKSPVRSSPDVQQGQREEKPAAMPPPPPPANDSDSDSSSAASGPPRPNVKQPLFVTRQRRQCKWPHTVSFGDEFKEHALLMQFVLDKGLEREFVSFYERETTL